MHWWQVPGLRPPLNGRGPAAKHGLFKTRQRQRARENTSPTPAATEPPTIDYRPGISPRGRVPLN